MSYLRINERFSPGDCSSDGLRFQAWHISVQGIRDDYLLPSRLSFQDYYVKNVIGSGTIAKCNIDFTYVHNFFLEQFFYGGILWFVFVVVFLFRLLCDNKRKSLTGGVLGFIVFLFFSPMYVPFYMLLLSLIFVLYYEPA